MAHTSSPTRQDTPLSVSLDGRPGTTGDPRYLEIPLQNGTSIFIPIAEDCVPTD